MTDPLRIGILGAGMIATCDWGVLPFLGPIADRIEVAAIASPTRSRAQAVATEFGIPRVFSTVEEMLDQVELDSVVNLTPISLHAETSRRILEAGKHLVTEKPLASTLEEADELIELAARNEKLIICSPPRMLEPSRKLARKLVLDRAIGKVAFARVRSSHAGPAAMAWPADPTWFYRADSGPLLDLGVYGIQEITGILGPAKRVTALSGRTTLERVAAGGAFAGTRIPVNADDNVLLLLDFGASTFAVVDSTFNVRASRSPVVEIFGLDGTIAINDMPVMSGQPAVEIYRVGSDGVSGTWSDATDQDFPQRQAQVDALQRAILIEHLVYCVETGEPSELSGEHARHSLEIMLSAQRSAREGRVVDLTTSFNYRG